VCVCVCSNWFVLCVTPVPDVEGRDSVWNIKIYCLFMWL